MCSGTMLAELTSEESISDVEVSALFFSSGRWRGVVAGILPDITAAVVAADGGPCPNPRRNRPMFSAGNAAAMDRRYR